MIVHRSLSNWTLHHISYLFQIKDCVYCGRNTGCVLKDNSGKNAWSIRRKVYEATEMFSRAAVTITTRECHWYTKIEILSQWGDSIERPIFPIHIWGNVVFMPCTYKFKCMLRKFNKAIFICLCGTKIRSFWQNQSKYGLCITIPWSCQDITSSVRDLSAWTIASKPLWCANRYQQYVKILMFVLHIA